MNERILNLLSLCMQAKEKGIDAFFYYSPHIGTVTISIHENGWCSSKDHDREFNIRMDEHCYPELWQSVSEAESYLKGLVENV